MSEPTLRRKKQCKRKVAHETAIEAYHTMIEDHGNDSNKTHYLCPHCNHWHIGHKLPWRKPE